MQVHGRAPLLGRREKIRERNLSVDKAVDNERPDEKRQEAYAKAPEND